MQWQNSLLNMIGGVGLLLYGMSLMKDNLQKVAGKRFREILILLTKNRLVGLGLGAFMTLLFQSSTATTVLLIGLTSASILTLRETLAVVLGADIGSTITAQLIALKATEIALPVIFLGSFIFLFSKSSRKKRIALVLMGFGILFLGLKMMADTMYPLKNDPSVAKILTQISNYPLLDIMVAAVFTFLISSSAATIGIIMLLAMQHMIDIKPAIYMLLGANIGTTFTPILSSIGSSRESQRVAMAHLLFKAMGVLLAFPLVGYIVQLMQKITASPGFQVAHTHTLFNILLAILFLPFIQYVARFLEMILPNKKDATGKLKPKYLDENLLSSPDLAMGMATKEIMIISDYVLDMIKSAASLLANYNQDKADNILEKEEKVDVLSIAANRYLTMLLRHSLTQDEFKKAMGLITIIREYEFIGDVVEKNMISKAESMNIHNKRFSMEGLQEIQSLNNRIVHLLQLVNTSFATNNCALAEQAKTLYEEIVDFQFRLRMSHIIRLKEGARETEETTFDHMELINCYGLIGEHLKNITMVLTNELPCHWQKENLQFSP
ncbi:Na/Pi cotransporter family protein [Desulfotomaculum sp. 1211_IL3151]|uniref:Na/Pi cotransporter family protein n=1 Tax=Desulfotomaculum sp. 1211_IL3151 TaxID=3084055 RepID=UPI002FDA1C28